MSKFTVAVSHEDGQTLVLVYGDLDNKSFEEFDEAVTAQIPDGGKVIVDLSELTFLDSRGLGTLVALWRRLERTGGSLVLSGARYQTARVLWVTGLVQRIAMADDVAEGRRQLS